MAAHFERAFKIQGFDRDPNPRWQMVPVGGTRFVILRDGAGLNVSSTSASVVRVEEVQARQLPTQDRRPFIAGDRFFKLTGVSKGNARIRAQRGTLPSSNWKWIPRTRRR
jgi:hypothetical protein